MTKSVAGERGSPDWIDETELKEGVHDPITHPLDKHVIAEELKEVADSLNFDERELERFEKSREKAWKQGKKEYGL
jgi:hypothetical protein